jgi:TonB family protein
MGVDFKPYLAQVLASVKRYWMAIWPEAARQGRSGKVVIQFSIDHFGTVPKLVIASGSGANALDFAAVAAIQSSVPFPILPRDYKGDLIKLQLNFAYNMPN